MGAFQRSNTFLFVASFRCYATGRPEQPNPNLAEETDGQKWKKTDKQKTNINKIYTRATTTTTTTTTTVFCRNGPEKRFYFHVDSSFLVDLGLELLDFLLQLLLRQLAAPLRLRHLLSKQRNMPRGEGHKWQGFLMTSFLDDIKDKYSKRHKWQKF